MTFRRYVVFILFFCSLQSALAQNVNDAGAWLATSFSANVKDISPWKLPSAFKGTQIYIDPEFRFDENITRLYGFFADVGLTKKVNDYVQFVGEMRIGARKEMDWYNLRKRSSLGLQLSLPLGKVKVFGTTRFQTTHVQSSDLDLKSTWRQKFGIEYTPLENWSFQLSHELFLSTITYVNTNWRSQFQVKYKLDKRQSLGLGYLVQRDLENADMDFVILASYKWQFKEKKAKKEEK